ncbi:MAG: PEP-CTERM sorting domain-containing protein [bacterium]
MFARTRGLAGLAVMAASLSMPRFAAAQVSQFQACSPGALANCAMIRLTNQTGAGPGNTNLFEIALQNMGSQSTPSLATSIYFLALLTGQPAAPELDAFATPTSLGGSAIGDASDWSIAESGDAIFLSAPGNDGVGGCASASPIGGFGQMANTCGANQFVTFSFFTPRTFDVNAITLGDLEFVAIANGNDADSCNDTTPCAVTPVTPAPEPGSLVLVLTGIISSVGIVARRKNARATNVASTMQEA